jgi:hypothetical protein
MPSARSGWLDRALDADVRRDAEVHHAASSEPCVTLKGCHLRRRTRAGRADGREEEIEQATDLTRRRARTPPENVEYGDDAARLEGARDAPEQRLALVVVEVVEDGCEEHEIELGDAEVVTQRVASAVNDAVTHPFACEDGRRVADGLRELEDGGG